ncbi:MAG: hypothetical protein U0936_19780 [Planctomycetaceae bacterium]
MGRKAAADDESLASFVRRRFGRQTLNRLVQPPSALPSDPEKLSLKAAMPAFWIPETKSRRRDSSSIGATKSDASSDGTSGGEIRTLRVRRHEAQRSDRKSGSVAEEIEVQFRIGCAITQISPAKGRIRNGDIVTGKRCNSEFGAVIIARTHAAARLLPDQGLRI